MQPELRFEVPAETKRVAEAAFPKGNPYLWMRDELGALYEDSEFAELFPAVGQPAESPGLLAMVLIMQQAEGLTDRQAATAVASRIDWKYALALPLETVGFDGSVLSEFRDRLIEGSKEEELLDNLLSHFQKKGWLKARGSQRTDSTHVLGAFRQLNRLELVGETLRQALEVLAMAIPKWLQAYVPLEWFDRYGRRIEQYRLPKTKGEQAELAASIGADGYALFNALYADANVAWVVQMEALRLLQLLWLQQYQVEEGLISWRQSGNLPPGAQLIVSPYDSDARYGSKREQEWVGYKVHLTETCDETAPHLITDVQTTPASTADVSMTETIQNALVDKGLPPDTHLLDGGYSAIDSMLAAKDEYNITTIAPVSPDSSTAARNGFGNAQFHIHWEQEYATCPQGNRSRMWTTAPDAGGIETVRIRFAHADCDACPVRQLCTQAQQGRSLRIRHRRAHEALQQARNAQTTDAFQALYAKRPGVEGTISQGVRSFHLRRSRYIGLAQTHLQQILTAAAINLHRLFFWCQEQHRSTTRCSRFAALSPAS